MSLDALFEKPLGNGGVITAEAEFKYFDADYKSVAFDDSDNFGMFDGEAYTAVSIDDLEQHSTVFIIANSDASASKQHQLKIDSEVYRWEGPYLYQKTP